MAARPPPRSLLWRLTSVPLRFKITLPYLILSVALALVATYLVSQGFAQTLQARFEGQLVDSANRANDGLYAWQEAQLAAVRAVSHTQGVPEAIAAADADRLGELLLGLAINQRIPLLDVLDAQGRVLYSSHLDPETLQARDDPPGDFARRPFVSRVLEGRVDERGDKFAGWYAAPWGLSLYTVGPILLGERRVGAAAIGVPAEVLLRDLDRSTLARIGLYDADGRPAGSTLLDDPARGEALPADLLRKVRDGGGASVPTRLLAAGGRPFVEAVLPLFLRGVDSGWRLSVALPQSLVSEARGPSLQQLLGVFTVAVLALIGLGVVVAQLVATPVFRLVRATGEVAAGQLDVQVPITAHDEIGVLTGRFNAMVEQLKQREVMRELFGRMVSEEVREAVMRGQIELGGESKTVSVLFSDIRAFTTLSEQFSPAEVVAFLNHYFSQVTGAVNDYGGIINRYGGDSTLAVFGAPVPLSPQEATRCAVQAALAIRGRLLEFNAQRVAGGMPPIEIGIGINTGEVVTGNIGSEERFEYTVIGDTVNVSARVQELTKRFPEHNLIVTGAAYATLPNPDAYEMVDLGEVALRGRHDPVPMLALTGLHPPGPECAGWAAAQGLAYRRLLEALCLHLKGYPPNVVAVLTGLSLDGLLSRLAGQPVVVGQLAQHLAAEYNLSTAEVEADLQSRPADVAAEPEPEPERRHRPGPPPGETLLSSLPRVRNGHRNHLGSDVSP